MTGWMTVELRLVTLEQVHRPEGFLAAPAAVCEVVAYPSGMRRSRRGVVVDEHFAMDADTFRQARWLSCADVLYGHHRRSWNEAVAWLAETTAAFEGCMLAASPLHEGGWAMQSGRGRPTVRIAAPHGRPQTASCAHGWMVAGGLLEEFDSCADRTGQDHPAVTGRGDEPARCCWRRSACEHHGDW